MYDSSSIFCCVVHNLNLRCMDVIIAPSQYNTQFQRMVKKDQNYNKLPQSLNG